MIYAILFLFAVTIAFVVRIERLQRKVNDIDAELEERDEDLHETFKLIGKEVGALTVRANRFEVQLGEDDGAGERAADVLAILDEAQAWAAATEAAQEATMQELAANGSAALVNNFPEGRYPNYPSYWPVANDEDYNHDLYNRVVSQAGHVLIGGAANTTPNLGGAPAGSNYAWGVERGNQ